jgi:magnesium-transporting ATPase (P-type)
LARTGTGGPGRDPWRGVAASAGHAATRGGPEGAGVDAGGLSHEEAAARLELAGPNPQARGPGLQRQLAAQLLHFFALLLWVAAMLAFVGQMPQLGWAIIAIVVVYGAFSFVQEYRAERATRALAALLPEEATALRDGRKRRVPAAELVPGDVLLLVEGDPVSVDARVLQSDDPKVDNAALTGESGPVPRGVDPLALSVLQILALDIGTDLLPALALGAEPPEPGVVERPPRPRSARSLDRAVLARAFGFLGPATNRLLVGAVAVELPILLGFVDLGPMQQLLGHQPLTLSSGCRCWPPRCCYSRPRRPARRSPAVAGGRRPGRSARNRRATRP